MIFWIAFLSHLVVAIAAYGIGMWHERYRSRPFKCWQCARMTKNPKCPRCGVYGLAADCRHKFTKQTGGDHMDCPACIDEKGV